MKKTNCFTIFVTLFKGSTKGGSWILQTLQHLTPPLKEEEEDEKEKPNSVWKKNGSVLLHLYLACRLS